MSARNERQNPQPASRRVRPSEGADRDPPQPMCECVMTGPCMTPPMARQLPDTDCERFFSKTAFYFAQVRSAGPASRHAASSNCHPSALGTRWDATFDDTAMTEYRPHVWR